MELHYYCGAKISVGLLRQAGVSSMDSPSGATRSFLIGASIEQRQSLLDYSERAQNGLQSMPSLVATSGRLTNSSTGLASTSY